mgnify:CR=1 FL=1
MATSSQKFIARNRAPRVQIEYDVELYGAEKKIQLPFVMGVLADLSGKPAEALLPVVLDRAQDRSGTDAVADAPHRTPSSGGIGRPPRQGRAEILGDLVKRPGIVCQLEKSAGIAPSNA